MLGQLRAALMAQAISPKSAALLFQFQAARHRSSTCKFYAAWQEAGFDALVSWVRFAGAEARRVEGIDARLTRQRDT